jgi:hypothetical protein
MLSYLYWAIGIREKQINSLTHNSMAKLPENKFINLARDIKLPYEDKEPHKNIKDYRSQKQIQQQKDYSKWYDYYNH